MPGRLLKAASVLLALTLSPLPAPARTEQPVSPRACLAPHLALRINRTPLCVELAQTDAAHRRGLMFRERLEEDEGMLFVFAQPGLISMWMKDTRIPLSVAFIDAEGRIINVDEMLPGTLDAHSARRPARYALEMRAGWFAQHGLGPTSRLDGLPDPISAR